MQKFLGWVLLLVFLLGPILFRFFGDEAASNEVSWAQLAMFYGLVLAGAYYVFFYDRNKDDADDKDK